jgi:hypothetical protein
MDASNVISEIIKPETNIIELDEHKVKKGT